MKYNPVTRRMFLQGAGKTLLAIPFLPSLMPRQAWGQSSAAPKRFISLLSTYDLGHNQVWLPNGAASPFNIGSPANMFNPGGGHHTIHHQALRDFAPTSGSHLAKLYGSHLSPYLESINILRSLDTADIRGHDCSRTLGGVKIDTNPNLGSLKQVPTIDYFINNNKNFNPTGLPLIFGGQTGDIEQWSLGISNGNVTETTLNGGTNLTSLYNALFKGGALPETGVPTPPHPRRDILLSVVDDFKRVMGSRNISSADRGALSDAMDKFSDIQKNMSAGTTSQCSHKSLAKSGDFRLAASDATLGKALADLITHAIMCDSVRVFTIGTAFLGAEYIGPDSIVDGEAFAHGTTSHEPLKQVNGRYNWDRISERQAAIITNVFAPLVKNLSSATDPSNGKSYLHNSLIVQNFMCGLVHSAHSIPIITAGNAGGAFKSGNYVDYADRSRGPVGSENFSSTIGAADFTSNWRGVSYNRLLVTILQSMGITPAEYEDKTLNNQVNNRSDIGAQNQGLTDIGGWGHAAGHDIDNAPDTYFRSATKSMLADYDLKQFKNKLPIIS